MVDFVEIHARSVRKNTVEIYPEFLTFGISDLMIRGSDFYAVWLEEKGKWSTDVNDVFKLVDKELRQYKKDHEAEYQDKIVIVKYFKYAETGTIDKWNKYVKKQLPDQFHMLDEKIIFSNHEVSKKDYSSKSLPYALEEGTIDAYDQLMNVLYSQEERHKIEWAIGSIVNGDSKKLQKFLVLYGAAGTGKSTVLNIIQKLFQGYYAVFDAKAIGSSGSQFALESFRDNPLVAIQHDGDLSRIEDNTRLNSLVSHETMTVNEKFKSTYANRFKAMLFMGTNKPVKITDARSGIIRRLIDVSPTGNKIPIKEYRSLMSQIGFELGAIAWHCKEVYEDDPGYYDNYIPVTMIGASNDFYNFVVDSFHVFKVDDGTTLKQAWDMYKAYTDEAKITHPFSMRVFKEELKNYFEEFFERYSDADTHIRSYYKGFKWDLLTNSSRKKKLIQDPIILSFDSTESLLDQECAECYAQYANDEGTPRKAWDRVRTRLKSLDTTILHYVRLPENYIVIDFDLKDKDGNKSFERNLEAASKWPPTYAELSKSGAGIHLHYIYTGDVSELQNVYAEDIEIKTCKGKAAIRRKLSKCNRLPVATISSGLPLKEKGENSGMVNFEAVQSENGLRKLIARNLAKDIHPGTKPSIDFIHKILEDAYESGLKYDVSDLYQDVLNFASGSSHQAEYCVKLVSDMKWKSEEENEPGEYDDDSPIVFFDIEVVPNLLYIAWKPRGEGKAFGELWNPTPKEMETFLRMKLAGYNNRKYDNHICYGRYLGDTQSQTYNRSKGIVVDKDRNAFLREAYGASYTDVLDFITEKMSLKKWEIKLRIPHKEWQMDFSQPVPEELWPKLAEYCKNDVAATEAVFEACQGDWIARLILADLSGLTPNDTTNTHTTRIIFGKEKHPQDQFNYRFMGDMDAIDENMTIKMTSGVFDEYTVFDKKGRPIFPGYKFEYGKSTYRGEEVGEGGYVYAEPGIHTNVALLDIASMHPSSIIAELLFGIYTKRYEDILNARINIKHKDFDKARTMLDGKLAPYLDDESKAKDLAQALKIAINSVYGLTAASFENPFRDPRNIDNIVAKRGALFMVNLKHEVQKRGFTVAHIKTDSIKIPGATPEIINFVMDYGKLYGYNFEHEATYDRMCLVNDAVYIAKYDSGEWTATGTQFQVPYVFKTLFSHEPIIFWDMCETKEVKQGDIFIDMNEGLPNVEEQEKQLKKLEAKYKEGRLSDTTWDQQANALREEIAKGHNYIFVGHVGSFCPIKPGRGGGVLYRYKDGKYYAIGGTSGYRWLEDEVVQGSGKEADIDETYYINLAEEAKEAIQKYGNFEKFISDEPYVPSLADLIAVPEGVDEEVPFK